MARYKFYEGVTAAGTKIVVCLSSFCKKAVRGIAKCNDKIDTYDVEYGKKLAQARCDEKICEKRFNRASSRVAEAERKLREADAEYNRMTKYLIDSTIDLEKARKHTVMVEAERQ